MSCNKINSSIQCVIIKAYYTNYHVYTHELHLVLTHKKKSTPLPWGSTFYPPFKTFNVP